MSTFERTLTVKEMLPTDQPRERLQQLGPEALTDSELLAILLRTGNRHHNVIDMSRKFLHKMGGLGKLNRKSWKELQKVSGMGPVKAITISAALELGRRAVSLNYFTDIKFNSSRSIANYFIPLLKDQRNENFVVAYLNNSLSLITYQKISTGGPTATVVDVPDVMKQAILNDARSIVLLHNHPSGSPNPSRSDRDLTQRLKQAAEYLGLSITDHIIIAGNDYYSFQDAGML